MIEFFDGGDFLGGLLKAFGIPFLIICIAVALFAYLVSIGKRRAGIIIGILLVLVAVAVFGGNFLD